MYGEVWGGVGGGKRSKSPKVQGFQGPRDQDISKLTFKYELDSKEGPSCSLWFATKQQKHKNEPSGAEIIFSF